MIESQVRTTYGSLDLSSPANRPTARPTERAAVSDAPTPKAAQAPGFTTYVVAPSTLLAAQEARESDKIRRDDAPHKNGGGNTAQSSEKQLAAGEELTPEEQQEVEKLKKVDREVRAHERAHRAAGGTLTGAAQYTYVKGPDGQMYAVAGEVAIDTGREASAAATVEKMEAIIRAALAPANPSSQDIAVAAQARQVLNQEADEARKERLNIEDEQDGQTSLTSDFLKADRAYRNQGAQDGQQFLADQARAAFQLSAADSFNFTI